MRQADPKPDDVLAVVDADCFITGKRWAEGASIAKETGRLVIPHDSTCRMDEAQSQEVLDGKCPNAGPTGRWFRDNRRPQVVSGVVFIRFDSFLKLNGFDETFVGWGGEDTAFKLAGDALLGPAIRLDGPLFHFHHDRQAGAVDKTDEQYQENRRRWLEYRNAKQISIFNKVNEAGYQERSTFPLGSDWDYKATAEGLP